MIGTDPTQTAQGGTMGSTPVHVLVFKDNFAARTFRIPLAWVTRFGFALGTLVGLTVLSTFVAVKYFRIAKTSTPERVQELEGELATARKELQSKSRAPEKPATGTPASAPAASEALPDPATLPFTVTEPVLRWRWNRLEAKFEIEAPSPATPAASTETTPANPTSGTGAAPVAAAAPAAAPFQGRFVLLARGPRTLLAYPDGTLGEPRGEGLVRAEKGESFTAGESHEVSVSFDAVVSQKSLTHLQLMVYDAAGKLLLSREFAIDQLLPGAKRATPPKASEPEASSPAASAPAAPSAVPPAAPAESTGGTQ